MERLDEVQRATLVGPIWRLRGAVIAERRMIAATLTDQVPVITQAGPRTPPAPPPRPQPAQRTHTATPPPAPTTHDPLQELAEGRR